MMRAVALTGLAPPPMPRIVAVDVSPPPAADPPGGSAAGGGLTSTATILGMGGGANPVSATARIMATPSLPLTANRTPVHFGPPQVGTAGLGTAFPYPNRGAPA